MSNVVSQLIIKLVDQVSGPASKAASSLQSVEKSATALGKSSSVSWGANFSRELEKLRLAPSAFREVQRSWDELQRGLRANGNPRASVFFGAMDQWKSRTLSNLRAVRGEADGLGKTLAQLGALGIGSYGVAKVAKGAVKAGANNAREDTRDYLAGLDIAESLKLRAGAAKMSKKYQSMDSATAHERLRDTANALGSVDQALNLSDMIGAGHTVLQSLKGPQAAIEESRKFFKGMDTLGKVKPDELRKLYDGFLRAQGVEGADMNMGDIFTLAKRAKSAAPALSDRFLWSVAPGLMQDMGPDGLGTALGSMVSQIVGGRATKKSIEEQKRYGLRNDDGSVRDQKTMLSDPLEYTKNTLIPALQKNGVDISDNGAVVAALAKLFSNQKVADLFSKLVSQLPQYDRKAGQYDKAPGAAAADDLKNRDPFVSYEGMMAQVRNLGSAISEHVIGPATTGMNAIADMSNRLANAAQSSASALAITAGGLTGLVAALNALKNVPGLARFLPLAPGAGTLAGPAAVIGAVETLRNATKDDMGTTSGERMRKYRGGSLHDILRRNFSDERERIGLPPIDSGDPFASGASPVRHLDQSGPAASAGEQTGDAFKTAIAGQLQSVDELIASHVQRWVGMLSFSASPSITPSISAPAGGVPGKQSMNGVSRQLAARVRDKTIGNFTDNEYA